MTPEPSTSAAPVESTHGEPDPAPLLHPPRRLTVSLQGPRAVPALRVQGRWLQRERVAMAH